ncbi:MAG: DUF1934 domain-containing protein [Bacillota bacterium]
MKKIVTLSIKSRQEYSPDDNEIIEYTAEGILYKKREKYYLIYENEDLEGSKSRIIIDPLSDKVSIFRDRPHLEQEFVEEQSFSSKYHTSYGVFDMDIHTKLLDIEIDGNGGRLNIQYQLYLNKRYLSNNHLDIIWN